MKYDKKDLMNEGWKAMESLLNEEMPTKSKDHNYLLIGLLVLSAFTGGLWLGTSLTDTDNNLQEATVLEKQTGQFTQTASVSNPVVKPQSAKNKIQKAIAKIVDRASSRKNDNPKPRTLETAQVQTPTVSNNNTSTQNSIITDQKDVIAQNEIENELAINSSNQEVDFESVNILESDILLSNALAVSYLPRSNNKVKKPTNWVLGLGLSSGINPGRNTKVASLKSEWMYKVGRQNAVGLEFIYAAEDKFGFLNYGEPELVEPDREKPKGESSGRENVAELIQNSRQFRYAAGLVFQQEIGFRFYSNLGAGINVMQNSYSNELAYKSLNTVDNIKYHWGGYTSLAFGYRISRLVDFEISGTKSLLVRESGDYQRGSTDQLVGGLKISF